MSIYLDRRQTIFRPNNESKWRKLISRNIFSKKRQMKAEMA